MLVLAGKSSSVNLLKSRNRAEGNWKHLAAIPVDELSASEVSGVSWSPTGKLVAMCGKKWEHIVLLNCEDPCNQIEMKISIPAGRYQNCCVFNKTGKVLATAGVGGGVYLWNENNVTGNWEQVAELPNIITMTTVTSISWDPSSRHLCTGDTRGHVTLREQLTGHEYRDGVDLYNTNSEEVSALTCNPHHPFQPPELAVGHSNGVLEVWDILSRTVRFTLHSHSTTITDIAYSTINGLLLATAGLDGEVHIVLLKSGTVVKKCVEGRAIHSLEFIKGTQKLVFLTDSSLVTFRLNKKWSERESEPHQGAMIARYHSARGPLFESQEAYLARTPQAATAAAAGRAEIVKNTPEYHPTKPSPESKGLQKDETSSLITSQNSIPLSKELSTSLSRNITEEERDVTCADKDSSFNISDMVNYTTDENLSHTPLPRQLPSIQKRSAEGLLSHNTFSPDSNTENTPSRTDNSPYSENLRNKLRRIAVEDGKENRPPIKVTPQDGIGKMTGRIVSSTPAVTNTNKQAFLTPTSCLAQSLNKREDSILHNRTPLTQVQRFKKSLHSTTTLQHVPPAHHLIPPADSESYTTITKGRSGFSVSSLFSSVGENSPMTDVSSAGPVSQEQLTPNIMEPVHTPSQILPLSTNTGGGVSNEQMVILQNQITEHFKGLEKTLLSETRWLKNEIVRQAVDTQFALEDILNNVQERQSTMDQRLVNMDQNISAIMRNM